MKLAEYLSKECVQVGVKAKDKADVLKSIAVLAKKSAITKRLSDDDVFQGFMEREKLGSTGFGHRIAIPHFTTDKIEEFVVGVMTVPDGVDFDSMDGKPTHVFVFIIAPESKRNLHLGILSNIAKFLNSKENVDRLVQTAPAEELADFIKKHRYTEEEIASNYQHNLMHVVVQREEKFEELLNVFAEIDDCHVSILEANNVGKYLYAMPLFASFWNPEQQGFNRIIVAVVKKSLTNRALQKINEIIDGLKEQSGIMVLVQDLFYSNGSLDV